MSSTFLVPVSASHVAGTCVIFTGGTRRVGRWGRTVTPGRPGRLAAPAEAWARSADCPGQVRGRPDHWMEAPAAVHWCPTAGRSGTPLGPGGAPPGRPLPEPAPLHQGLVSRVRPGMERPVAGSRQAHGGSWLARWMGDRTEQLCPVLSPGCGSVAGGAELVDDVLRDATTRGDLDLVRRGPCADGLRAVVDGGGRPRSGGSGSVLPAADLACGPDVAVQGCPQVVRVLVRQIDFILATVEGEVDRFAGAIDDLGVVQVIDESDNRTLRHLFSLSRRLLTPYDMGTSGRRTLLPWSE